LRQDPQGRARSRALGRGSPRVRPAHHARKISGSRRSDEVLEQSLAQENEPHHRVQAMRAAFVGTGFIADWHEKSLRALKDHALVAVCDKNLARAEGFATRVKGPAPAIYSDLETMLSKEAIDAVHVLVPPEIHHRVAKPILERGVSVFLEKPMCTSVAHCDSL